MSPPSAPAAANRDAPEAYAGPSTLNTARWRPLPRTTFRSIEYPGPMQRAHQILKVANQQDIDDCFNANAQEPQYLEMRYRPEERSGVPVRGTRVASQKVLVKVVKRRRKAPNDDEELNEGVFTADIIGSIPQTVRFRSMADYQYTPSRDGHIAQLTQSLLDLDYDAILDYSVPPLHEEYIAEAGAGENGTPPPFPYYSLTELQPTPVMSQRHLPFVWNYKMNSQTVEEQVWDEEQQEYKSRFVNKSRVSGWAVPVIGHNHQVPTEPEAPIRERIPKLDARLYGRLIELMEQRPVWQRYALLAQFPDADRYEIESNKVYLPATGYTYGAGPFWKCIVRYGYDPCADRDAHKYQRVYVYLDVKRTKNNILNSMDDDDDEPKRTQKWWEEEQERRIEEGLRPPIDPKKVYIYDGQVIHRNKPDYQLVDILDPIISKYIFDPISLGDTCEPHSGWYRPLAFELIKGLLRVRYAHLRDHGETLSDEGCAEIVETYERALAGDEETEAAEAFIRRLAAGRKK
ncbi:tau 95 subunit of transcription factor TFIIIC [Apiotrichum porosum]|uniref:Tau 95 subunit of transcription factor TFIIIC n=1 Tax=Apiotrichum porosum TaxID=105984 RepID=A0A427XNI4_9TREE|nr:tau 95 subunit of transcription factor TFIIIC [Apiotrichum porosum]RSH80324.1 tau 95 subunit of transcription factor TFIIIC [Apiotrichum porosum]